MTRICLMVRFAVAVAVAMWSVPAGAVSFTTVGNQTLLSGAPLCIPLDGLGRRGARR